MTYATLCSGIGAPELAFSSFGWKQAFCAEIEPFPCAVLKHHFPDVPNYGDITKFKDWSGDHSIDLLIGGTPCQSFSIAGLRKGMADPRGNLALTFLAIARRYTPAWVVWENVPGVLSVDNGRAFGSFLGGLAKLGYGFAYRVLDAQFYGVAQRRRRVFVVGHIGGQWQRAAAVLFERESLFGNTAPSREKREGIAPTISARTKGGGGLGTDFDCDGGLIADTSHSPLVATALQHRSAKGADSNTKPGHLIVSSIAPTMRAGGNRTGGDRPPGTDVDTCETLVAFSCKDHGADAGDITPTLRACGHNESHANSGAPPAIAGQGYVRRLTPRECERLQGFPDDFTAIEYRGKPACDGPRYKALGNSMAAPVVKWVGDRIRQLEGLP